MLTSDLVSVNFLLNFHGMNRRHEKHPNNIVRNQQGAGYAEQSLLERTRYITYVSRRQKSNRDHVPEISSRGRYHCLPETPIHEVVMTSNACSMTPRDRCTQSWLHWHLPTTTASDPTGLIFCERIILVLPT